MSICFVSPNCHDTKIPRNYPNMRTKLAWQCALNADHENIYKPTNNTYDTAILILPKNINDPKISIPNIYNSLSRRCGVVALMQEGPVRYYQNWSARQQHEYLETLMLAPFNLAHNTEDRNYMQAISGKPCYVLQSLIIEDAIHPDFRYDKLKQDGYKPTSTLINGTFAEWYSGMDSYLVAKRFKEKVWAPSMGRQSSPGEQFDNNERVNYMPYVLWSEWMKLLSGFKYAVNLNRYAKAGTFNLNTAYYGIPTVTYNVEDSSSCHIASCCPDIAEAFLNADQILKNDDKYQNYKDQTRNRYLSNWTEESWLKTLGVRKINGE